MPRDLILFVCEHGAAKSILAAAYFNKMAAERGLNVHAIARGTHPDQELSPKTVEGLERDGLHPTETMPQKLTPAEVESAQRIISFCELPAGYPYQVPMEQWNDNPPVSENYETARDAIIQRIDQLLDKK